MTAMSIFLTSDVPCNGCTACCRADLVIIHPEHGDRLEDYDTLPAVNPIDGKPCHALKHVDGHCLYLGKTGCTIYHNRPAMCRAFDCRRAFLKFGSRAARRRAVKAGWASIEVIEAGRQRLNTLEKPNDQSESDSPGAALRVVPLPD